MFDSSVPQSKTSHVQSSSGPAIMIDASADGHSDMRMDSAAETIYQNPDFIGLAVSTRHGKLPPEAWQRALNCPYHRALMQMASGFDLSEEGTPRSYLLLSNDPGLQSALLVRPDTGQLSTTRDCGCREILEQLARELPNNGNDAAT